MTFEEARDAFVGLVKKREKRADVATIHRVLDDMIAAELARLVLEKVESSGGG